MCAASDKLNSETVFPAKAALLKVQPLSAVILTSVPLIVPRHLAVLSRDLFKLQ
jgi:hypothetical protein